MTAFGLKKKKIFTFFFPYSKKSERNRDKDRNDRNNFPISSLFELQ